MPDTCTSSRTGLFAGSSICRVSVPITSPLVEEEDFAVDVDVELCTLNPISPFGTPTKPTFSFVLYCESTGEGIPGIAPSPNDPDPP